MSPIKKQNGAILVLTLLVSVVLAMLAGTLMLVTQNQLNLAADIETMFNDQLTLEGCHDFGHSYVEDWNAKVNYPDSYSGVDIINKYLSTELLEVESSSVLNRCNLKIQFGSDYSPGTDLSSGGEYGDAAMMGKSYSIKIKSLSIQQDSSVESIMEVRQ